MAPGNYSYSVDYFMQTDNKNISDIIYKHLQEEVLTDSEKAVFDRWLAQSPANQQLLAQLSNEEEWKLYLAIRTDMNSDSEAYEKFKKAASRLVPEGIIADTDIHRSPVHRVHFLRKWGWAAASVLILIAAGAYFWNTSYKKNAASDTVAAIATDIAPGKNGAILTLSDGTQVVLDSLGNGIIASQGGAEVTLKNSQLTYDPTGKTIDKIVYNTMSTPKGRQFQVTLPDGTQVWLNSASSIRYPTAFAGKERKVEMTGEAYFEVARNTRMPFRVNVSNEAEIEVLGTHFNVNAYENESRINTTLLEGSVHVKRQNKIALLKPGQQAQITIASSSDRQLLSSATITVIDKVNTDKVMAWKNGFFNFEDATLDEVMRQLERWYDIDVVYENGVPQTQYYGKINKQNSLQELLHILEKNEVHFRLESGNRLVVSR